MKEYLKYECSCLIDINTGEPIVVYWPKDDVERAISIQDSAYRSGVRFRMGLEASNIIKQDD